MAKPVTSGCLNPKGQVQPQLPALTGRTWAGMQHQALFAWKATRRLSSEVMWVAGCFGLFFRGHSQGWYSTQHKSSPATGDRGSLSQVPRLLWCQWESLLSLVSPYGFQGACGSVSAASPVQKAELLHSRQQGRCKGKITPNTGAAAGSAGR